MRRAILLLALASLVRAEDVTFTKARLSAVNELAETRVAVTLTDAGMHLVNSYGRFTDRDKARPVNLDIPWASVTRLSYGFTERRRILEGLLTSPVLWGTMAQAHWLVIERGAEGAMLLRLDKSEYRGMIAALNAKSGKRVEALDPGSVDVDPTNGSKDVDEVVPFAADSVRAALKAAMSSYGCKVKDNAPATITCHRGHKATYRAGFGGEKVKATIEARGSETRVIIKTEAGLGHNWSTPFYREMRQRLKPQP
jgi:hypothetical protein